MSKFTLHELHMACAKLDSIFRKDADFAAGRLRQSPHLIRPDATRPNFYPMLRVMDGIRGGDMAATARRSQESIRYRHCLHTLGYQFLVRGDSGYQDHLGDYLDMLGKLGTGPSKPDRMFWVPIPGSSTEVQAKEISFGAVPQEVADGNMLADETLETFFEGAVTQVTTNRRERDCKARKKCVRFHKTEDGRILCAVCDFDFYATYGEHGRGFIHIHHKDELSDGERESTPTEDLIPVCPNCHAMIHRRRPALSVDELKDIIARNCGH